MAKIEFDGFDEYVKKIQALGGNVEGICKQAVYPAAGLVIEEIKRSVPVDTGALRDSAALNAFVNDDGYIYTEVTFRGTDERGHPNPVKARALESGTSRRKKRPFIRPAVNRVKGAAEVEIERNFLAIIDKMMGGN